MRLEAGACGGTHTVAIDEPLRANGHAPTPVASGSRRLAHLSAWVGLLAFCRPGHILLREPADPVQGRENPDATTGRGEAWPIDVPVRVSTDLHNCVMDAHGGYLFENRSFTVPAGVTLHFYSDHGSSVMDPGRGALELSRRHHRAVVRETLSEGDTCHNYLLSKSWGDHIHKGEPDKVDHDTASKEIKSASLLTVRNR